MAETAPPFAERASPLRTSPEPGHRSWISGGEEIRSPERTFTGGPAGKEDSSFRHETGHDADRNGEDSAPADGKRQTALTEEEKREVQQLKKRDQEVRAHEQAHMAAAGGLAKGGPSFETTAGPDGKRYAVGGEVHIDSSGGSTPEGTIAKARQIRAAAMAPAEPSGQDQQVAAQAARMEIQARREKAEESPQEQEDASRTPEKEKTHVPDGEKAAQESGLRAPINAQGRRGAARAYGQEHRSKGWRISHAV